ncbi:MAG: hypothetical protein IT370_31115 [Deltaproteobacteria bacterium]|nr:hypothetical protein [Deltaproteobacteria bacterium]
MTMNDDCERAIESYRRQLRDAGLGAADAGELCDHLRELVAEARADAEARAAADGGTDAAGRAGTAATAGADPADADAGAAVARAVARLGEPRTLAAEYARARPAFGLTLSWARAFSAALLLLPVIALAAFWSFGRGVTWLARAEVGLGGVLVVALLARLSWARAILLGFSAHVALESAVWAAYARPSSWWLYFAATYLGVVAFLAPWRRHELSASGWALALTAFAFPGVSLAFAIPAVASLGTAALAAYTLGAAGVLLRARWAAPALALVAALLVPTLAPLAQLPTPIAWLLTTGAAAAVLALLGAALTTWRTTRGAGSLRALAR